MLRQISLKCALVKTDIAKMRPCVLFSNSVLAAQVQAVRVRVRLRLPGRVRCGGRGRAPRVPTLARKLSFYGRILEKTVFFWRQKCEISLKCPANLRNFA